MSAIILDTETTGIDEPDVIQLAHTDLLDSPLEQDITCHSLWFRPTKPITYGAMATHHILEEDVVNAEGWPGRWDPPDTAKYIVGHNVDFDWKAIGSPPHVKRICTLALSRRAWPDVDSHSLGALTYWMARQDGTADIQEVRRQLRNAHNASVDLVLTCSLLKSLVGFIGSSADYWEGLYQLSENARVPERMSFGKYGKGSDWAKANNKGEGMRCGNVRKYDSDYYSWLISKCDQVRDDPYLRKALG